MTLTGIDFLRMLYLMGADRGEDIGEEEYKDVLSTMTRLKESRNRLSH